MSMPLTLKPSLFQNTLVALPVIGFTPALARVMGFHLPGGPVSTSGGDVYDWRMTAETAAFFESDMPASPGVRPSRQFAQIICGARHNSRCDFESTSIVASTSSPAANSVATMRVAEAFQVIVCTEPARPGVASTGAPPAAGTT